MRQKRSTPARRAKGVAGLAFLGAVTLVLLLLTAFGPSRQAVVPETQPAKASRLLPGGPPTPQVVALHGSLQIQLPIARSRVTAIGYHAAGTGALALTPIGRQANQGLLSRVVSRLIGDEATGLRYYQLEGGQGAATSALDVGAAPGSDVYAPVDGTIVGITDYVVRGRVFGARVDIRPSRAPSLVVSLTQLRPDRALKVGSSVAASRSKVGVVLDLARVERQALARYTQDAGNHVTIEVFPAATPALP